MNPTQDNNENHMVSVEPVVIKTSKLKVFTYIILTIIIIAVAAGAFYVFKSPASAMRKTLTKLNDTKIYQVDTNIIYYNDINASSSAKINLLAKVDATSKLLMSIKADMNIMDQDIKLESKIIDSGFYLNINKADFVEMFLGKDLLYKWIYISQKDVKNNPFGVNIGSTTVDDFKGIEFLDKDIIVFKNSKIQFVDGKMMRKNNIDIDKDKLIEYVSANIDEAYPVDNIASMKESLAKTEINDMYIVTDFFDNSLKSMYANISFKEATTTQSLEISLKYDDMSKTGLTEVIEAPKDFTTIEDILKNFMNNRIE